MKKSIIAVIIAASFAGSAFASDGKVVLDAEEKAQIERDISFAQHDADRALKAAWDAQDMADDAITHSVGVESAMKSGFEAQAKENAKIHARIDNVEKDVKNLKAGVAGAIAIGMLDVPAYGTHGVGVAVGGYDSASALAIGYTVRFNERTNGKVAVALDSANNASYGASVGYSW